MTYAVVAEGISKKYQISTRANANTLGSRLRGLMRGEPSAGFETIWALDDVSFSVPRGEIFGIIGRNGSGKSTLLKILTGIVRPTRGRAAVRGRVGALLEVGTGFHPDLTGRENVYFNGTLLGMSKEEIDARFDEIVAFAEIEKFIDTQFKHYSSGMQSRLGFAVSSNMRPEVLILDEVLSVGDLMFQEKCMARVADMRRSGMTVLFVSHSLSAVGAICSRAMLLDRGRVIQIGEVGKVVEEYVPKVVRSAHQAQVKFEGSPHPSFYIEARLEDEDGNLTDRFDIRQDIWVHVRYGVREPQLRLQLALLIRNTMLEDVVQTFDTDAQAVLGTHPAGIFQKRLRIPKMFLKEGDYHITMTNGSPRELHDFYENALQFTVTSTELDTEFKSFRRDRGGKVVFPGEWHDVELGR
jgi:lipopolysaccharide transport system ATP-binding protein